MHTLTTETFEKGGKSAGRRIAWKEERERLGECDWKVGVDERERERKTRPKARKLFARDEQSRARVIASERAEVALLGTWHC